LPTVSVAEFTLCAGPHQPDETFRFNCSRAYRKYADSIAQATATERTGKCIEPSVAGCPSDVIGIGSFGGQTGHVDMEWAVLPS